MACLLVLKERHFTGKAIMSSFKFYKFYIFKNYRVIKDFMIQGGDFVNVSRNELFFEALAG